MGAMSPRDPAPMWERPDVVARFAARPPDRRLLALFAGEGPYAAVHTAWAPGPAPRVLDIGCAGGRNSAWLAQQGADVWALDASAAMVAKTRERLAAHLGPQEAARRVSIGEMRDLRAHPTDSVDLVVALGVYQDAADDEEWCATLAETARVLRPGGLCLVANFGPDSRPNGVPLTPVPGEPKVRLGFGGEGRRMTLPGPGELDADFARYGMAPALPTRPVRTETPRGHRVTLNALYRRAVPPPTHPRLTSRQRDTARVSRRAASPTAPAARPAPATRPAPGWTGIANAVRVSSSQLPSKGLGRRTWRDTTSIIVPPATAFHIGASQSTLEPGAHGPARLSSGPIQAGAPITRREEPPMPSDAPQDRAETRSPASAAGRVLDALFTAQALPPPRDRAALEALVERALESHRELAREVDPGRDPTASPPRAEAAIAPGAMAGTAVAGTAMAGTAVEAPRVDGPQRAAFAGVAALGRAYRAGGIRPTEVVDALLGRIERLDGALNAFALVLSDEARAEAATAERELASGIDRGPLHGVPVAVKDLMAVEGAATRYGSTVAPIERAPRDAEVVARLRRAGAVVLGKTTLLEYAYGAVHPRIGPTSNPWDPGRTAGGSSGGSAAALAAGLVPLALGTDTGGSIRIPAAYCGVVGFKPSHGRLPLDGVFPLSWSLDAVGPMARSCADALAMFDALDDDGTGRLAVRGAARTPGTPSLRGARLGVPEDYLAGTELEPGVAGAFREAVRAAGVAGAEIVPMSLAPLARANAALLHLLYPEASVIHEQYIRALGPAGDPRGDAPAYAPVTRMQIELGFALPATAYVRARQLQAELGTRFADLIQGFDALLTPSVGFVAPAEDPAVSGEEGADEMYFSGPFNLVGAPAVSLPFGTAEGMPVGLQVVTAVGRDRHALLLGCALEALAPAGPRVPEGFESA